MSLRLPYYSIVTAENLNMAPRLLLGLIASTLTLAANAQFLILDQNSPPQIAPTGPAVVNTTPGVGLPLQISPVSGRPTTLGGMAVNDSVRAPYLKDTLHKIVPPSWSAYVDRNLNVTMPVEYTPASDWK